MIIQSTTLKYYDNPKFIFAAKVKLFIENTKIFLVFWEKIIKITNIITLKYYDNPKCYFEIS